MKKFFTFCFLSFFSLKVLAQQPADFSVDKAVILSAGEQVAVEAGVPVFLNQTQIPKEEFNPIKASWKPNVQKVRIKSFGNQELDVPYLTHIPSFFIYVNVLPDKSIVVTERLTLVLSEQQESPFIRSYPLSYLNEQEQQTTHQMDFLWASYNNQSILPRVNSDASQMQLIFFEGEGLPSGVHFFEISYLLKDALQQEGNTTKLFLPLFGYSLPYLTERLQVLVTYPQETKLFQARAFFGKNNQISEQAYDVYIDENGHLIYKIKGLLPQMVDVRLDIVADAKGFQAKELEEKINQGLDSSSWLVISLICSIVLFIYFRFAALDVQDKSVDSKYLAKVRSKITYDIGIIRWLHLRKIDVRTVLAYVLHLLQRKMIFIRFDENGQMILFKEEKITPNSYERKILHFLFGSFGKQKKLSDLILSKLKMKKLRHLILKNIHQQMVSILKREALIGFCLPIIALLFLIYLSVDFYQIFAAMMIISVAYLSFFVYFIKKSKLVVLLQELFKEYTERSLNMEKRREVDIALGRGDYAKDTSLPIILKGKRVSVGDFEQMFLTQIHY